MELEPLWDGFTYREHQTSAVQWMLEQEQDDLCGGFLCDEMGLGKTMEILGLVKNSSSDGMTLLIGPLAIVEQWSNAAVRSQMNVFRIGKSYQWERNGAEYADAPSIYITHYDFALRHLDVLTSVKWTRLVLDEAHRLGNAKTTLHNKILEIESYSTWIVTGTPIVNNMSNAVALFHLLGMPLDEIPKGRGPLSRLIRKKALYRSVAQLRPVVPDLPKKEKVTVHSLPFSSDDEAEFYRGIQGNIVRRWRALEAEGARHWAFLKLLMMLRQLSVHPQVYINGQRRKMPWYERQDWSMETTKFEKLQELIVAQSHRPHKWLVFAQFHDEIDLLTEALKTIPRVGRVQSYSGLLDRAQREEVVRKSKLPLKGDNNTEILILQLHAGSVGLNLQHFDRVAFMSPWWTAALMDQAIGRAVRIGQDKRVEVHHIRLEEEEVLNIDEMMMAAVERKRDLCDWFLRCADHLDGSPLPGPPPRPVYYVAPVPAPAPLEAAPVPVVAASEDPEDPQ